MEGNYLIYNPKGNKPKRIHHSWHAAREEAERIAKKELTNIYILRVDSIIKPRQRVEIEWDIILDKIDNLT